METEPKDVIVLGSIRRGKKKFSNIQNETKISGEKKGLFGKKIELKITETGSDELDRKIIEIQSKWKEMKSLYENGDKQQLQQKMEENKSFLPTMMFFGVMDMMMFSMMFSMMGIGMSDFVSQQDMADQGMDDGGMDDGGFDFDIGF